MGFLNFLFRKQVKTEHGFFGTMLFLEDKKHPAKSYFECRRVFSPSGKTIEMGIDGDETGPTQKQVDFFTSIENNYSTLTESWAVIIENEFRNWKENFKITNFQKEFEPVYLQLPRCEETPVLWQIDFETGHDRNHTITIDMADFEATGILIDG